MKIIVDYVTTLPLLNQSPKVIILEEETNDYEILFIDNDVDEIISHSYVKSNQYAFGNKQWYTNWKILVKKNNEIIFADIFNPLGETIRSEERRVGEEC